MKVIKEKIFLLLSFFLMLSALNFVSAEDIELLETEDNVIYSTEKIDTTISSSDMYLTEKGNSFNITLTDINGDILANQPITINVNTKDYDLLTDENGVAKLNINLNIGNYEIITKYQGNNVYNSISVVNAIFMRNDDTVFIFDGLTNIEIQKIIDSAPENSKIEFMGKEYNDISLLITKPLNLISHVGTVLNGVNSASVVKFSSVSSGKLSGFTISNGLNGVEVCDSSKNILILNNSFISNIISIYLNNAMNIDILENKISKSETGIKLFKTSSTLIKNNTISFGFDGIYFDKQNNEIQIESNNISYNTNFAININENGENIVINGNTLFFNGRDMDNNHGFGISQYNSGGINLNANIRNLNIFSNLVSENNMGIYYGSKYIKGNHIIEYNVIAYNLEFNILARDSIYRSIEIGANYVEGDESGFIKVCEIMKLYKIMPTENDGNIIYGPNPSMLPTFLVPYFVNGEIVLLSVINGTLDLSSLGIDGEVTVSFNFGKNTHPFTVNVNNSSVDPNQNTNSTPNDGGSEGGENPSNNYGSGSSSNDGTGLTTGSVSNEFSSISKDLSSSENSLTNIDSSSKSSSSASESKRSVSKVIELDDEIIRVLGISGLIFILILVIGLYYHKDIKEMLSKRRNDI
ncbi:right-handed parallel beta-helix repeat-containing protein [Methanobrevibacter sp. DSM 116169]|uniref:right-handed parallel beta-helix repeat-containing protein n=1 Tax=Methanobrevibacter sp. DSM 116169 TaxID=3242727 RepID=UPI0038FD325C